jgi:DUF4097 and DUF4098 domain-containing protein YvlB
MKSVLAAAVATAVLPLALGGCVVVDSQGRLARDEKRFTVSGPPEIKLTTFDGNIEIRSADTKTVVVEIEKRGPTQEAIDDLKVETKQDGDRIEIEVKRPPTTVGIVGFGRVSPHARLTVTMPRNGSVVARSGDGAISIAGINGRLELRTGDGNVRATDVNGAMTIATGDGAVTIENSEGDVDIDTGDGSVSVAGKLGVVKVHTGDGSITFRADPGSSMKGDWSMITGDGGVAVYLPADFSADLDAHTGDGVIRSDLKIDSDNHDSNRRTLRGKLGAGGKLLKIRTGDGGIRLKES